MSMKFRRIISLMMVLTLLMQTVLFSGTAYAAVKEIKKADICFVIDTTGSMSSYINKVRQNLQTFVNRLESNGIDLRMAIVEYKDVTTDETPLILHTFSSGSSWTTSTKTVNSILSSIRGAGGGDTDETPTNALNLFPDGRGDAGKFVFLLTDAGFKDHNSSSNSKVDSMEATISSLQRKNVCVSVVSKKQYEKSYQNLYGRTNGIFIDIDSSDYATLMLQIADWIQINALEVITGNFSYASFSGSKDASAVFNYSDSYFFESSEYYNNHLASMSICLALSISSTLGKTIKETTNKDWPLRTKNIQELFSQIGFEHFDQSEDWNAPPSTNTIGAAIASKRLAFKKISGEEDTATLVAIAVRGTGYFDEWGGNFNVGKTGFHTGFLNCRNKVLSFLREYLIKNRITGRIKLWITGYSRAGATSNLVAGALNSQMSGGTLYGGDSKYLPSGVTLAHNELYAYPLEPPMGVLNGNTNANDSNIHNVVNIYDPVPKVAMTGWDFTRYNKTGTTSHTLPNTSSKEYDTAVSARDAQYNQIIQGQPSDIDDSKKKITYSEYGKELNIKVKPKTSFFSFIGLNPPINVEITLEVGDNRFEPMDQVLNRTLNTATSAISRESYYNNYQVAIVNGIQDLLGQKYDTDFGAYADNAGRLFIYAISVCYSTIKDNLLYIISPLINVLSSREERIKTVASRLEEITQSDKWKKMARQKLAEYDIDTSTIADADRFVSFIKSALFLLKEMIVEDYQATIGGLFSILNGNVGQAHEPEVTMSWLRSQDSFYTESPANYLFPNIQRIIRINCPVNVIVREDGNIVARITGEKTSSDKSYISCYINRDDEKIITLPADEAYSIEIIPTDSGSMSFSIDEYNMVYDDCTRVLNYYTVPIQTGNHIYAMIPVIDASEYADAHRASSANYMLTYADGTVISPSSDIRNPMDLDQYSVEVSANNVGGLALGGGRYVEGSFAKVTAVPYTEDGFIGWYADGKLLSSELEYRFPVTRDITLEARFKDVNTSHVKVNSVGDGFVYHWDADYPVGAGVELLALPNEASSFLHWEIKDGDGTNYYTAANAIYTVGEGDAIITGYFGKEYKFLFGEESTWAKNSEKPLMFIVNTGISNFDSISIDGKRAEASDYRVSSSTGKLCIELQLPLLMRSDIGKHDLMVHLKDGYAATSFYVVEPIPKTGDQENLGLWFALFGISLAGIVRMMLSRRKRKGRI